MKTKLQVTAQEEQLRASMREALKNRDYEKIKEQLRQSALKHHTTSQHTYQSKTQAKPQVQAKRIPNPPYGPKARLFKFLGGFIAITFLLGGLGEGFLFNLQYVLPMVLIGGGIFFYGRYIDNLRDAYRDYAQVLINDGKASFKELSFVRGKPIKTVIRELEGLKKRKFFKRILIDKVHETLVIGPNTVANYLNQYAKREAPEDRVRTPEGFSDQKEHLITIEKAITRLDEGPVKESMERILELSRLIMAHGVEKDSPHQEIRRFLNHYLPMGANLMDQYASLNHQPYLSESLEQSKRNIEDSLLLMEEAFKNILLEMGDKNALEIESSIGAMEYMFKSDGLTK